jgi:hypothetical protein
MPAAGNNPTINCTPSGIRVIKSRILWVARHVRYSKYGRDEK